MRECLVDGWFEGHIDIVTICKELKNWDYPLTAYENESLFFKKVFDPTKWGPALSNFQILTE